MSDYLWCSQHNCKWQQPYPRPAGEVDMQYIGHVMLHQTAEGAVFVYWHSMDFRQEWQEVLLMQAKEARGGEGR